MVSASARHNTSMPSPPALLTAAASAGPTAPPEVFIEMSLLSCHASVLLNLSERLDQRRRHPEAELRVGAVQGHSPRHSVFRLLRTLADVILDWVVHTAHC